MDQLANSLADLLETVATRARTLTVDRAHKGLRWAVFGLIALVLAGVAITLLVRRVFHLVAHFTGTTWAYAIFGGLFLLAGALVWSKKDTGAKQ